MPTATTRRRAPSHRRRKDERPKELLEAALDVFVEKGYALAKTDEVAARAGVSKGTLYLYYPSKDALLLAVVRHYLASSIVASAERFASHQGSTAELLAEAMQAWWLDAFEGRASAVLKLMVAEARAFPEIATTYAHEVIEPAHRFVGAAIERGIERGEFRAVDVGDAVRSLVFPLVMLCVQKHSLGACAVPACGIPQSTDDARRFIANHLELVLRGIAAHAPTPKRPSPPPPHRKSSR